MNAPWLFAEAYKYRRLQECFSVSKHWKNYDVFFRQKVRHGIYSCLEMCTYSRVSSQCDTFSRSSEAVFELSMRFAEPFAYKPDQTPEEKLEAERLMFLELTQSMLLVTLRAANRMLT